MGEDPVPADELARAKEHLKWRAHDPNEKYRRWSEEGLGPWLASRDSVYALSLRVPAPWGMGASQDTWQRAKTERRAQVARKGANA